MSDLAARARKRAEELENAETMPRAKCVPVRDTVAADITDILRALADRVDEQERRIKELERFKEAVYRVCVEEGVKHHSRAKILAEFQDALDEALSQKGGE